MASAAHAEAPELEVAAILLELPQLIERETSKGWAFGVRWGTRRRRSGEEESETSSRTPPPLPPPPPLSGSSTNNGGGKSLPKIEASSPATPLSFSPSDTEYKSKQSKRAASKKKTVGELMEMEKALGSQREQLRLEISKVAKYRDDLRRENSLLQAKVTKIYSCKNSEPLEKAEETAASEASPGFRLYFRRDETPIDRKAVKIPSPALPDLNSAARPEDEEAVAVGFSFYSYDAASKAAAAAEARRRRLEIHRGKNAAAFRPQPPLQRWR